MSQTEAINMKQLTKRPGPGYDPGHKWEYGAGNGQTLVNLWVQELREHTGARWPSRQAS